MNGLLSKKINELVSTLKGSNINENVALARIKELFPSEEFKLKSRSVRRRMPMAAEDA